MKQLLTLFSIACFAFGCSSSNEADNITPFNHTIPKPGSTFTYVTANSTDTSEFTVTVMDTGLEILGKKNVSSFGLNDYFAYEPNGDFAILEGNIFDTIWVPQPVVSKKQMKLPQTLRPNPDGTGRYTTIDYTVTPLQTDDRVVDGKNIKGYSVLTETHRIDYRANGEVEADGGAYPLYRTWSHEIGLWTYWSSGEGEFKYTITLKSYALK